MNTFPRPRPILTLDLLYNDLRDCDDNFLLGIGIHGQVEQIVSFHPRAQLHHEPKRRSRGQGKTVNFRSIMITITSNLGPAQT